MKQNNIGLGFIRNYQFFYSIWANKMLYFIYPNAKVQGIFIQPWIRYKGF